jgi:hypothetical protein
MKRVLVNIDARRQLRPQKFSRGFRRHEQDSHPVLSRMVRQRFISHVLSRNINPIQMRKHIRYTL